MCAKANVIQLVDMGGSMSKYIPKDITLEFMIWRMKYLPEHENKTPITHYKMIDYYVDVEPNGIGMIQCHRGLGKTQLGMEFSLFCICEGYEKYVLFVGGTQDLSNDIVGSASLLAAEIPNITVKRSVEGVLEIINVNGDDAFMVAKSTGSKLRGIAKGKVRQRPTAIVVDDIVDDQLVMNRLRMSRANSWMTSALLPTLVPGGRVFGSGTPMHSNDPFLTLCNNFGSFKIPLSDTSFPDRFTPDYIKHKKDQYKKLGQVRDFKREFELVLTDNETQLFDMKKIKFVTESTIPANLTWFMSCDLAFSEKDGADYSAFTCVGISKVGEWYVYPVQGRYKPSVAANKIIELATRFHILDIGIETGSSYIAVNEHLQQIMLDQQQYFNIVELKHGGKSKISRVSALEPIVEARRMVIIDNGDSAEALVEQMELTDSLTIAAKNDDLIDALAYMINMNTYYNENSNEEFTREEYMGLNDDPNNDVFDDEDDDDLEGDYGGGVFN